VRCGDNGIFRGVPVNEEQNTLTSLAAALYRRFPYDGKYVSGSMMLTPGTENCTEVYGVTICQSHATEEQIDNYMTEWEQENYAEMDENPYEACCINPLGEWTGGPNTDSGATNRKLGSDMGDAVTGGGLMGKDLSKADVSVNIVCHLKAQEKVQNVTALCSIGDEEVTFHYQNGDTERMPYHEVVRYAREYITAIGGFERFAEWGLIRPKAE
jgi:S-adenosylmethionine synthetase